MSNSLLSQINALGISITLDNDGSYLPHNNDVLVIPNTNLRNAILNKAENTYGKTILKMSLPSEYYARYKNGTLSSMIKGGGTIVRHQGHEELCLANIVDNIFYEVSYYYTECVLTEFRSFANQMLNSVAEMNSSLLNAVGFYYEKEKIDNLETIRDFLEEILEDIADISISKKLSEAYLSQIIAMRLNVMNVYNYLMQKMWKTVNILSTVYGGIYDPDSIFKDYILCRQAIGSYSICTALEQILSGNIDERNTSKVIKKIEKFSSKFNEVDQALKNCLRQRSYEYSHWNSWRSYQENNFRNSESQHIQWFIDQCINNDTFEVQAIKKLFSKSQKLLENIIIEAK